MNKTQQALDNYDLFKKHEEEVSFFNEYNLLMASNGVLTEWKEKANRLDLSVSKNVKLKNDVDILINLFKAYKLLKMDFDNIQARSVYYKMKYEGVKQEEEMQEFLKNQLQKLLDENEELKKNKKKYTTN